MLCFTITLLFPSKECFYTICPNGLPLLVLIDFYSNDPFSYEPFLANLNNITQDPNDNQVVFPYVITLIVNLVQSRVTWEGCVIEG